MANLCSREPGSVTGYGGWKTSLKYKAKPDAVLPVVLGSHKKQKIQEALYISREIAVQQLWYKRESTK